MNIICPTPEKCRITRTGHSETLAYYPEGQLNRNKQTWTENCAECGKQEECSTTVDVHDWVHVGLAPAGTEPACWVSAATKA